MAQTTLDCTLGGQPPYNCQGCNLSGMNLAGKDLTQANLQSATLTGTIFKDVVSMAGANLTGATMGNGTDFSGCDLSTTIFGPNPNFGSNASNLTKLIGATIPYATLGTTWRYLDLTKTSITGLPQDLTWLEVIQCNLPGFNFAGRTMKNAHFSGVNLQGADFTKGTLDNIVFQQNGEVVCDLTNALFPGAELTAAVFDSSTLTDTDFTGATLAGASFLQTRMDGTKFDNTTVTTCSFSAPPRFSTDPANLTSFRGATLNYSTILKQWSYLDLTGATLVGLSPSVDLTYLQARYAVLTGMDLSNYTLNQCNLSGATLTGVKFSHALMSSALLYGVQNTSERFRIPKTSADYQTLLTALNANNAANTVTILAKYGLTLSTTQTTVHTDNPKQWWTVTDASTKTVYPVTNATSTAGTFLIVMDMTLITRFDNAKLPNANFSPNNNQSTVLHGANFTSATLDGADFSLADVGQVNPYNAATAALFTSASMNSAGLSQANLTGANLTGTVYLHDADLSMSILKNVDLTGAQLGSLAELFRVPQTSADYQTFHTALQSDSVGGVATIFNTYKHPISTGQSGIATTVANRSWTVTDSSTQTIYTVLNWTASDGATFLIVSTPTPAAKLTGAYMPGATLVDANLYSVSATHVQLYGAEVHLDGAILDNCAFSNANLGGSSIIVKTLYNVNLSDANLINATLKGADLTQGVTLAYANLQGTVFTGTTMNTADLSNAAVAVSLDANTAGVYLFGVHPNDPNGPNYQTVLAELQAAVNQFELAPGAPPSTIKQYINDLNRGDLADLRPLFLQNGSVTFSQQATIAPTGDPDAWQVLDPGSAGNYTVWHGYDDLGSEALLARPSLPALQQVFTQYNAVAGTLRWQASISAGTATNVWLLDNDSTNPKNLQLGYATMLVNEDSDGSLAFYGTTLRIQQLGDNNQLQIRIMSYGPTILCPLDKNNVQQCNGDGSGSFFGPSTNCPNARFLSQNQNSTPPVPWAQMLRFVKPPVPPACVPSPYGNCPQVSAATLAEAERRRS
ncbi:MAG: pentapeptide repeat-containing protein [Thermomicrobiales bacterium]